MSVFCPRRESAPSGRIVNYSKTAGAGGGVAVGEDVSAVRRRRRCGGGGQLPRCSLLPSLHVLLPLRRAAAVAGLGAAARLSVITSSTGVHTGVHSGVQRTPASSTPHQYQAPHRCQHLEQPHTPHPGGHEAGWQLASRIFSSEENECWMDAGIRQIYIRPDSYLGQARGRYSGRLCTPHCSNGCVHAVHCGQCEVSSALHSLHYTTLYYTLYHMVP